MSSLRQLNFPIEGMSCASCVSRVERALAAVPGVASASVNLATESVAVALQPEADVQALMAAVARAGYGVPHASLDLSIDGMTCATCVAGVEKALRKYFGKRGDRVVADNMTCIKRGFSEMKEIPAAVIAS